MEYTVTALKGNPSPFLDLAEQQIVAPRKARMHAAQERAVEKALADRDKQVRLWRQWRRQRIDELLAGPHAVDVQALIQFLDQLENAPELIAFVRNGPWHATDADTRFLILGLIDIAIVEVRERRGLPPFDDAMPFADEPLTAFQEIRELLK